MPYYIKDAELGLFVGECLGLGFYEIHIKDGTLSPLEKPIPFDSEKQAWDFLKTWSGGIPDGTSVVEIIGKEKV